jgi:manganese/zinc/iron transport system permease protein
VLLAGAAIAAVLGTLCVHAVTRYTRLRDDAAMALVLSVFFGAGIVLMSYIQKNAPDQSAGLNKFLFGQTAAMHARDVALMASLAAVSLAAAALLFKELALVCFNDAFARVDGWPVSLLDLALMTLVVLVTVAGLQAVGILLVVAMLIVPPAAARFWTDRLWLLVVLSGLLGAFCGYLGAAVSALLPRKPAGAVIVLTAGAVFALSMLLAPRRGVLAAALRAARFRLRIAADHLLEAAAERADAALPTADARALARTRRWPAWLTPLIRRSLRRRNLATFDTTAVRLTPAGLARGLRVRRNHLLWEQYLVSHADIAPGHVDWSADQVEHVLPDDLIDRLEAALTAPRAVPHA